MLSKLNSFALLTLVVALLLLTCFIGSTAYCDGGGGEVPIPPPLGSSGDGSGGSDGSSTIITLLSLLQFLL
jgi:hypothetical protein